nr:NAD-dependent epimerase/dehydratase family protein [Cytobacillus praedii]
MSVFVLGGAGYIGSHAVYQLLDQGENMVIASSEKAKLVLGWNLTRTSVTKMIKDAWKRHSTHLKGYDKEVNG